MSGHVISAKTCTGPPQILDNSMHNLSLTPGDKVFDPSWAPGDKVYNYHSIPWDEEHN